MNLVIFKILFSIALYTVILIFPLRFGVSQAFVYAPALFVILGMLSMLYKSNSRFNKLDRIHLYFVFYIIFLSLLSILNVGFNDAFNGARIYLFPFIAYLIARRFISSENKNYLIKLLVSIFFTTMAINLLYTYDVSLLGLELPKWTQNYNEFAERDMTSVGTFDFTSRTWIYRSLGVTGQLHASGLYSVCGAVFLYYNSSAIFKNSIINILIKFFCILSYITATNRTAMLIGLIFIILDLIIRNKITYYLGRSLLVIFTAGILFLLDYQFQFYGTTTYYDQHIGWWTDTEKYINAFNYTIVDGLIVLKYQFAKNILMPFVGLGYPSQSDIYTLTDIVKCNDSSWAFLFQIFGLPSVIFVIYLGSYYLRLIKYIRLINENDYRRIYSMVAVSSILLISNIHSDVLKVHGLSQLFFILIAFVSFEYNCLLHKTNINKNAK